MEIEANMARRGAAKIAGTAVTIIMLWCALDASKAVIGFWPTATWAALLMGLCAGRLSATGAPKTGDGGTVI